MVSSVGFFCCLKWVKTKVWYLLFNSNTVFCYLRSVIPRCGIFWCSLLLPPRCAITKLWHLMMLSSVAQGVLKPWYGIFCCFLLLPRVCYNQGVVPSVAFFCCLQGVMNPRRGGSQQFTPNITTAPLSHQDHHNSPTNGDLIQANKKNSSRLIFIKIHSEKKEGTQWYYPRWCDHFP